MALLPGRSGGSRNAKLPGNSKERAEKQPLDRKPNVTSQLLCSVEVTKPVPDWAERKLLVEGRKIKLTLHPLYPHMRVHLPSCAYRQGMQGCSQLWRPHLLKHRWFFVPETVETQKGQPQLAPDPQRVTDFDYKSLSKSHAAMSGCHQISSHSLGQIPLIRDFVLFQLMETDHSEASESQ